LAISKDLDLDMVRLQDQLLDVHGPIAKGAECLTGRAFKGRINLALLVNPAHSLSATARSCLQKNGIADFARDLRSFCTAFDHSGAPGHAWYLQAIHGLPSLDLIAHLAHAVGRWPDKD